ncbi:aspartate/glutamate racemase family protein [Rivihabitans pingtungensis]|uniref:aspartate/glutamate racemase family protein n=1 Tax=Rivihabitans pingtungensis TaxID=1054498 RepID=UPI002356303D|nr:aspartate/glutamate racemase family protein [Rivihabitans pingtungensis]MCK6438098.1 aspartate/glutamate racemase family protein [Rivihabitans pingtungensis]
MHIRLINPNTSAAMTASIGAAAQRIAAPATRLTAVNPADGPESIESHFDDAIAAVGVCEEILRGERDGVDAYIIACFGDPGLNAARELTRATVIGIAQAAFHMASLVSTRFSVVTTLRRTVILAEHLLSQYGCATLCASVRATDIPVLALEHNPSACAAQLIAQAQHARDHDGAGAIVLGCGGMAGFAADMQAALGIPVIDGVSAAVKLAEAAVGLGLHTSKHGDLATPLPKSFTGRFAHFSRSA